MAEEDVDDQGDGGLTQAMSGGGEDFLVGEADKPKTNPGLVVALVAAIVGGGAWLYLKKGPASASAATAAATPADDAKKTISEFLSDGGKDLAAMEKMLQNTESVVKQFLAYPSMTQVPLSELRTNPFSLAGSEDAPAAVAPDRAKRDREALKAKAIEAVSGLKIESLMTGRNGGGTAIINGKFVKPGDEIEGFRVEEIRNGSVVVRDENFRFELKFGK